MEICIMMGMCRLSTPNFLIGRTPIRCPVGPRMYPAGYMHRAECTRPWRCKVHPCTPTLYYAHLCRHLQHLVICPLFWAYQNPIVGICPLLWAYMPTFVGICAQIFVCTGRAYIYLMSYLKVALYIYCHTSVDIHKCDLDFPCDIFIPYF